MIRDKSNSKLSTGTSKSKVKQAIRLAMGKTPTKQAKQKDKIINDVHPRRSLSTKNLRTNNYSAVQIGKQSLYSGIKRGNSQRIIGNNYLEQGKLTTENDKSTQLIKFQLQSYQWWHRDKYEIQTQSKISEVNGKKSYMKYFAFLDKKKSKKTILVAIQNDSLYIGSNELAIYLIDALNNQIESVNSKVEKINLFEVGSRKILIVGNSNQIDPKKQYSIKSLSSGVRCNPFLEKFILKQINAEKSKFFSNLIQNTIESQLQLGKFYLCLQPKTQPKSLNMAQEIMRKIFNNQNIIQKQKQKNLKAIKGNFISNIKISEHALLRLKK